MVFYAILGEFGRDAGSRAGLGGIGANEGAGAVARGPGVALDAVAAALVLRMRWGPLKVA